MQIAEHKARQPLGLPSQAIGLLSGPDRLDGNDCHHQEHHGSCRSVYAKATAQHLAAQPGRPAGTALTEPAQTIGNLESARRPLLGTSIDHEGDVFGEQLIRDITLPARAAWL
jgi:hypothetical protein